MFSEIIKVIWTDGRKYFTYKAIKNPYVVIIYKYGICAISTIKRFILKPINQIFIHISVFTLKNENNFLKI